MNGPRQNNDSIQTQDEIEQSSSLNSKNTSTILRKLPEPSTLKHEIDTVKNELISEKKNIRQKNESISITMESLSTKLVQLHAVIPETYRRKIDGCFHIINNINIDNIETDKVLDFINEHRRNSIAESENILFNFKLMSFNPKQIPMKWQTINLMRKLFEQSLIINEAKEKLKLFKCELSTTKKQKLFLELTLKYLEIYHLVAHEEDKLLLGNNESIKSAENVLNEIVVVLNEAQTQVDNKRINDFNVYALINNNTIDELNQNLMKLNSICDNGIAMKDELKCELIRIKRECESMKCRQKVLRRNTKETLIKKFGKEIDLHKMEQDILTDVKSKQQTNDDDTEMEQIERSLEVCGELLVVLLSMYFHSVCFDRMNSKKRNKNT